MYPHVVIITHAPYPNGMALTKRLHYYTRAIIEAGGNAEFLLPNPSLKIFGNLETSGYHENVKFTYTCNTSTKPSRFLARRKAGMIGYVNVIRYIISNRNLVNAIIDGGMPYLIHKILITRLAHILGMIIIQEKSEFPFFKKQSAKIHVKLYQKFFNFLVPKLYDGTFVISEKLFDYYKSRIHKRSQLLLIPVLVNVNEYMEYKIYKRKLTIVSAGSLSQLKDGTLTLIKAFSRLLERFPDYKLICTGGNPDSKEFLTARSLVESLNISENVEFTGFIPREELIRIQKEASVLVLAKPSSLHADHCFPTKLGEYLATGNPVVVTDTGEISKFLTDKENAFLAKPDSEKSLVEQLSSVLLNYEEAIRVGKRGLHLAETEFDYKIIGKPIIEFIEKLRESSGN